MTTQSFGEFVRERYGVLSAGKHTDTDKACVLEAASAWRRVDWTDNPDMLDLPDLRPLNDAPWRDDEARTEAMIRLFESVRDWASWPGKRRLRFAERVITRTAREVLPVGLRALGHDDQAEGLARARTFTQAAASAVWDMSDMVAAVAARPGAALGNAGRAAASAVGAVKATSPEAADDLLQRAITIWIEEARKFGSARRPRT
ncbi:MAG: hypothetical protein QW838_04120 [Candidatus Nitrosotenuis sp.]